MMGDEEQEEPRSRNLLTWPVHSLLHWIMKAVVLVVLAIRFVFRPKPVRYGLLMLLVAGGIGWKTFGQSIQPQTAAAPAGDLVAARATTQLPQPAAVEDYLKAQAAFDAAGIWNTIGDAMKQQLQANNASQQALQDQLDAARQQGRRYTGATYVGGVPMQSGDNVYFYVVTVETPAGASEVPYIYVLGPDGKIASIQ